MSKSLSERLRKEADVLDHIQNFDGRHEAEEAAADASKYREIADALDAKDALLREAREALKLAQTIIGHPDDAGSQHIASVISKLEAAK